MSLSSRHLLHSEEGVTLAEVMMASFVSAILAAAFLTLFVGFNGDVRREELTANALGAVRPVVAELLIELRQAVDIDDSGEILDGLESSWADLDLVFHSDRLPDSDGPEQFRYYLDNCADGRCELMRSLTLADVGSDPDWTYTGGAATERMLSNLIAEGGTPLFLGVSWEAGAEVLHTACDVTTPCAFDALRVVVQVEVDPELQGVAPVVVREDVRFRNAPRT